MTFTAEDIEAAMRKVIGTGLDISTDVIVELRKQKHQFREGEVVLYESAISAVYVKFNNHTEYKCRPLNLSEMPTWVSDMKAAGGALRYYVDQDDSDEARQLVTAFDAVVIPE